MAPRLGLEPRIYSLEGCCLIHSAIGAKSGGLESNGITSCANAIRTKLLSCLHSCYAYHRAYNYKQSPSYHYFDINIVAHPTPNKGDKSTYTA